MPSGGDRRRAGRPARRTAGPGPCDVRWQSPRPTSIVMKAMRRTWRPPATSAQQPCPRQGQQHAASASSIPPGGARSRQPRARRVAGQRGRVGGFDQAHDQRHRQRARREGDDDGGDQQRLRHRVGMQPGARTAPGQRAEQHEHARAHDVESDDLAQRMREHDQPVQADADQRGGAQAEQRLDAHGALPRGSTRSGGPASSRPRISVNVGSSATSTTTIIGLAHCAG